MKKFTLMTAMLAFSSMVLADTSSYKNVFLTYFSTDNVRALMTYAKAKQLKGFILWEFRGDMPYGPNNKSLLYTAVQTYQPQHAKPPMFMGYWSDWNVYSKGRVFGQPAYGVPGSLDGTTGQPVVNTDFQNKLTGMNVITYAFLEAQDNGTLFFFDPWSDLNSSDYTFCHQAGPKDNPSLYQDICYHAMKTKPSDQNTFNANVKMGNFAAFAALKHASTDNPLGPLKKIFSIGGYAHDATFEKTFQSDAAMKNFVLSTQAILTHYKYDGVDLDYENPNMTPAQSEQYAKLIELLSAALIPQGKQVYVTILSNPQYLKGTENNNTVGFKPGTLSNIAQKVTGINLMTYDFHGAFDYKADGSGKTGFLSNLSSPTKDPNTFTIENSISAAIDAGVPQNKIAAGVPAYGRTLQNIAKGSDTQAGFNQTITNAPIPKGNLDDPKCDTDIATLSAASCSGSFEYSFINKYMLGKGFTEKVWPTPWGATSAYASEWQYTAGGTHSLTISNLGQTGDLGIIVSIKDAQGNSFGPSDYLAPDKTTGTKTYTQDSTPSTSNIEGKSNLTINWSTYANGPHGSCKSTVNFTQNTLITIAVNNQGQATTCSSTAAK